jgi:hypothetical protein
MRSAIRLKQLACVLLPAFALICAIPVAVAGAHGGHESSQVEVRGVVTSAPTNGSGSFTATAYVVEHSHLFAGGGHRHGGHGWGGGKWGGGNRDSANIRASHSPSGGMPADGTPGTAITTDGSTEIRIDGQQSSVSNLAVGDYFTAAYDGTPDESLSTITATPALSVSSWAPADGNSLYAFVGTVSGTDPTAGTVTVNVTGSFPNGLFSGTDTFDVGSQTIVLGNSGSTLFGSLGSISTGDAVAGGLVAPSGATASAVESTPLQVLVDFPQSSSSSTSSANAQKASIRRAERRALKLLRRENAKHGHHKKK